MPHVKTFDEEAAEALRECRAKHAPGDTHIYAAYSGHLLSIGQRWHDKYVTEHNRHLTTGNDLIAASDYLDAIESAIDNVKRDTRENCFDEVKAIMHARADGAKWCERCRAYPCECKPDRCEFGCECGGVRCHA